MRYFLGQSYEPRRKEVSLSEAVEASCDPQDRDGELENIHAAISALASAAGVFAEALDRKGLLTSADLSKLLSYRFSTEDRTND